MINSLLRTALLPFFLGAAPLALFAQDGPAAANDSPASYSSQDIEFQAHDGVPMFGRLALPTDRQPRAIVIYVQTAEGATVDQKRPLPDGKTFNYYDLYRDELTKLGIGFFSYEGRGIRMGDSPPRYESIDRQIYNTSTLANKVNDVLSALHTVRSQAPLRATPIFLLGASEGTLIATEAAAQQGADVAGLVLYGVQAANLRDTFQFILTDGDFLRYRPLDKDHNDSISTEEWDSVVKHIGIDKVDQNGDAAVTLDDVRLMNKPLIDAVDNEDFATLQTWAVQSAALAVPDDWFKDHFAHAELWSFLKGLKIPVGIFHGDQDRMAPMAAVEALESTANMANMPHVEFHYFKGLDHTLNIGQYFVTGELPTGHQAIFAYIDRVAPQESR